MFVLHVFEMLIDPNNFILFFNSVDNELLADLDLKKYCLTRDSRKSNSHLQTNDSRYDPKTKVLIAFHPATKE